MGIFRLGAGKLLSRDIFIQVAIAIAMKPPFGDGERIISVDPGDELLYEEVDELQTIFSGTVRKNKITGDKGFWIRSDDLEATAITIENFLSRKNKKVGDSLLD